MGGQKVLVGIAGPVEKEFIQVVWILELFFRGLL